MLRWPYMFIRPVLGILCLMLFANISYAQSLSDTIEKKQIEEKRAKPAATPDTSLSTLLSNIENITHMLNRVNNIMRRGFDTTAIAEDLPQAEHLVSVISKSMNSRQALNMRSMHSLQVILLEMKEVHEKWQSSLGDYSKQMATMSAQIKSILTDSVLFTLPQDPVLKQLYFAQVSTLDKKWKQADTANSNILVRIGLLQNRVSTNFINITDLLDETDYRIRLAQKEIWNREEKNIWSIRPKDYKYSFDEIMEGSITANRRVFAYYYYYNWDIQLLNAILAVAFFCWVTYNIQKIKKKSTDQAGIMGNTRFLKRSTILSTLLTVFTLGPFLYVNPPILYLELMWTIQGITVTALCWPFMPHWVRKSWLVLIVLYIAVATLNLLLQSTFAERWAQLFIQICSLFIGFYYFKKQREEPYESEIKYIRYVILLFIVLMIVSLGANIFGRVLLSKLLAVGAIFSLISGQALVVVVSILLEAFYVNVEANKDNSRVVAFFDFHRIREGLTSLLYFAAGVCWFIILTTNLNIYNLFKHWVLNFLQQERKLGNSSFTFSSILIFFVVIWLSVFLSRLMMYMFGGSSKHPSGQKNRWGNAVLLVRIAVLGLGILLAFAASGIPMDKITIIIGALGVGIGFGLQNIVNNLVSGVILAFEKPIQIGDVIDLGTRSGTVKEIGLRASKIATYEGSEIIVPNGDLLSQQLINWTLSDHIRRTELLIGVGYGTDLRQANQILKDIIAQEKGIIANPAPFIMVNELADSSINFKVYYWTDIDVMGSVKSEVLIKIYDNFNANNIEIPFPQSDIHIKDQPNQPTSNSNTSPQNNNELQ
ncbi:mechanosensitive ion channel-like protein [Chitinophaga skermanii]|uniref:Mechanosensitive ion channel-like protein n=1 Tax=Chitinophaga skermanii TaxID=331697 RepID=A0A327QPZ9_9BACT|nr:mechanosensitive ion channel domain-containing protein [Chitinophaga skermanii]RAJ03847.1 mechanosensitive ion channel-like protein [Chitinophaga skermanii]